MARRLVTGGTVVTCDPGIGTLAPGDVLIEGNRIAAVAPAIDAAGAAVLDARGRIVMPGLVNAHLHTWQTAIRGVSADWSLEQYFARMHRGVAASFTPDDIYLGTLMGALAQLDRGVTTLFDWLHNNPTPAHSDGGLDGLIESGIRAVFGHGSPKHEPKPGARHFSEVPHPRGEVERLLAGKLADRDGRVTLAMAILGPYFSTWDVTAHDLRLAAEQGLVASAHMDAGHRRMVPDGIRRMAAEGLISPRLNIVHGSDLSDEEIALLAEGGASFSITAEAEMHYGFGTPITGRVIAAGGLPSIGTDTETGIGGDMFAAMRVTLQMQRAVDAGPRVTEPVAALARSCAEALDWATMGGAKALGLADRIGSLTPGKHADLVLLRADDLNLFPVHDPVAAIVLHAHGGNVETVIVDGEFAKRDGRLLYPDLAAKKRALARSGRQLVGMMG
jgi:cytosine/adenosine deaminase-related metal-dependent hydrolase